MRSRTATYHRGASISDASRRFDLVLVYELGLDDTFSTRSLTPGQAPYVLLPAAHRLAAADKASLFDLCDEPLILLDVSPSKGKRRVRAV